MKRFTVVMLAFLILISFSGCVINDGPRPGVKKATLSVPEEYLGLFTDQTRKQFGDLTKATIEMKSGLSASTLSYIYQTHGNAYGYITEIFKIGLKDDKPLGQIIRINPNARIPDCDTSFTDIRKGGFDLKYKDGSGQSTSKVVFNVLGPSFKLNSSHDNLLYYDIDFKKFSIAYDNGSEFRASKTSIFFLHEYGKLIFLRKNKALYTIFISDDGSGPFSKQDTVLSLFKQDIISGSTGRH